ncbi:MAG: ABC transporter transmembrane domain-containing protein, partial [Chloroflexi bacterium]|nr:ABC transporter transmembrane domain-containing protein [Chloroflexota bacterium]
MVSIFRLLRLTQKYWFYFLLALISLLATTTFNLAIPKILGYSVDHIVIGGQSKYIYIAVVAMISAYIFRGIFAYGQNYFGEVASQKMAYELRNNIFNHLQQLSFSYYDKAETGQLMSRATSDVEAVRMFVSRTILNIIQLIVLLLAISTILFMINVKLALITMGFVPIIIILGILMSRRVGPMWLNVQQFLGIIATTLQENLVGVKVVKAFSRQEPECKRFYSDTKNLYDEYIKVTKIRSFMVPLMIMLVSLPVAIILWYGGHEIINGRFTIGDLTQFIFYFGIMANPIRLIGPMFNMASRAASAGKRILDILDETDRIKESPDALILNNLKGSILFENVSFGYNTNAPILDNVSF